MRLLICGATTTVALLGAVALITALVNRLIPTAADEVIRALHLDVLPTAPPFASYRLPQADATALRTVLAAAAGLYVAPTRSPTPEKTVLFTIFNQFPSCSRQQITMPFH